MEVMVGRKQAAWLLPSFVSETRLGLADTSRILQRCGMPLQALAPHNTIGTQELTVLDTTPLGSDTSILWVLTMFGGALASPQK